MQKKVAIKSLKEKDSDFAFWQQQTEAERLAAIEMLRQQYIHFKFPDAEPRFQRVYRIIKQK
jgi:hypothetical protein